MIDTNPMISNEASLTILAAKDLPLSSAASSASLSVLGCDNATR